MHKVLQIKHDTKYLKQKNAPTKFLNIQIFEFQFSLQNCQCSMFNVQFSIFQFFNCQFFNFLIWNSFSGNAPGMSGFEEILWQGKYKSADTFIKKLVKILSLLLVCVCVRALRTLERTLEMTLFLTIWTTMDWKFVDMWKLVCRFIKKLLKILSLLVVFECVCWEH